MELLSPSAPRHLRAARWRRACACLALTFALAAPAVPAASPAADSSPPPAISGEYQVKAAFLFNFAQFVEWPAAAFSSEDAPLVIGVLGRDPFGRYLDELVRGEKVGERALVIRRPRTAAEIAGCHILFVSRSESGELARILPALSSRAILTISDADNFSREGGMVRFATENGKIRLRINLEAIKAARLVVSSKILRPATIVTAGKD